MKNIGITTIILLFSFVTSFCQWGNTIELSSKISTELHEIKNFSKISASDDFIVYVDFSNNQEEIRIEANENLHEYIIVEKEGDLLKLRTRGYSTKSKLGVSEKLVAHITAKKLTAIIGDDDAEIELMSELSSDNLDISLDSDATLKGEIEVTALVINLDEDAAVSYTHLTLPTKA